MSKIPRVQIKDDLMLAHCQAYFASFDDWSDYLQSRELRKGRNEATMGPDSF